MTQIWHDRAYRVSYRAVQRPTQCYLHAGCSCRSSGGILSDTKQGTVYSRYRWLKEYSREALASSYCSDLDGEDSAILKESKNSPHACFLVIIICMAWSMQIKRNTNGIIWRSSGRRRTIQAKALCVCSVLDLRLQSKLYIWFKDWSGFQGECERCFLKNNLFSFAVLLFDIWL